MTGRSTGFAVDNHCEDGINRYVAELVLKRIDGVLLVFSDNLVHAIHLFAHEGKAGREGGIGFKEPFRPFLMVAEEEYLFTMLAYDVALAAKNLFRCLVIFLEPLSLKRFPIVCLKG